MSKVPCHKAASVIKCTFAKKFIFNYNKDIAEIMRTVASVEKFGC